MRSDHILRVSRRVWLRSQLEQARAAGRRAEPGIEAVNSLIKRAPVSKSWLVLLVNFSLSLTPERQRTENHRHVIPAVI